MHIPRQKYYNRSVERLSEMGVPELRYFEPTYDFRNGGPDRLQGGFAMTYHVKSNLKKKDCALRVWTKEIEGIKERSKKISDYLKKIGSDRYFVQYEYISKGLKVKDDQHEDSYDVILMDWIEGQTLVERLDDLEKQNNENPAKVKRELRDLAYKMKQMFKWLHLNKISHGDLQHDNIMISNNEVILCDYDSVYVPTFHDELQITNGLDGYQHPIRKNNIFKASCKDDYFSELIIYSGLLALSIDPELWKKHDERCFIFSYDDFIKLESDKDCETFNRIRNLEAGNQQEILIKDELDSLLDLLIANLKCKHYEQIKPIPGISELFCPICGLINQEDNRYCPRCGFRISKLFIS